MIAQMPSGLPANDTDFIARSSYLVIDDFQGMRSMLTGVLKACGANPRAIDTAANGPEAIQLLTKKRFDIVLCDFNLGHGQNGMQILEEAKFRNLIGPGCCWIMVTAEKTVDTVMGTAEAQPDAYLLKPVTEAVLTSRIAKIRARKETFTDIDRAVAARDYLKAIRLCEERAASDKVNAIELLRTKCDLLTQTGQSDKARQTYEKILASREIPWAQLGLAKVHMQAGEYDAACNLLETLIDRNRNYLDAYDSLAETYQKLGESERAEDILERAIQLSPNSHARQRVIGELALRNGKLDRAEKAFRKTLKLSEHSARKSPEAFLGLARTVGSLENPKEALSILEQMNKVFDGEDTRIKGKAVEGHVYHRNGMTKEARDSAEQLSAMLERGNTRQDSETAREMAELLLATGHQEKGLNLLQSEIMNNPDDERNLDAIKQVFRKAGLAEQGDAVVESSRKEATRLMNAGILLAHAGNHLEAIGKMRDAVTKMPRNVRLLLNAAHIMLDYMEQAGVEASLIREVRSSLLTANQLAPNESRFVDLMARLEKLTTRNFT